MVSLTPMYRRPKSLEVILSIRTSMSEEAGHDISTFVEMVRTGVPPADNGRIVTRVNDELYHVPQTKSVAETSQVPVSDE